MIIIIMVLRDIIKDTRIHQVYSGRKRKATGFVYLQTAPYRDAEV